MSYNVSKIKNVSKTCLKKLSRSLLKKDRDFRGPGAYAYNYNGVDIVYTARPKQECSYKVPFKYALWIRNNLMHKKNFNLTNESCGKTIQV